MTISALKNNKTVKTVYAVYREAGTCVFLVGGAVRDCLMGSFRECDCDFVVESRLDEVCRLFAQKVRGKIIPWDEAQRRVVFRQGMNRVSADFSLVKGGDITQDLRRRDFTVNSIAVDIENLIQSIEPCLIDPMDGADGIRRQALECCHEKVFNDDPLRILRAVRFERQCGFKASGKTLNLMKQHAALINSVSKERIIRELFAILNFENVHLSLTTLQETGLLKKLIPEVARFHETTQGYPHLFNLFNHSLLTVKKIEELISSAKSLFGVESEFFEELLSHEVEEAVTRKALLMFSAFLHDSGKTETRAQDGEKITFYGHEKKGAEINSSICARLGLSKEAARIVGVITANHMRVFNLLNLGHITTRAIERFIRDARDTAPEVILLAAADAMAKGGDLEEDKREKLIPFLGELMSIYIEKKESPDHKELLTGRDVMQILNIAQGPEVGFFIGNLRELEAKGLCSTRDEAIAWIKRLKQQK